MTANRRRGGLSIRVFRVLVWIWAAFIVISPLKSAVSAPDGMSLLYTLTVEPRKDTVHVNLQMEDVRPGKLRLCLRGGNTSDLIKYVSNLEFRQQTERLVAYALEPENPINVNWEVFQQGGTMTIDYDLARIIPIDIWPMPTVQKQCVVYIGDQGGALSASNVFIAVTHAP